MTRLRLTITFVHEYEADPKSYGDGVTPEAMAEVDRIAAEEDPGLFLDSWSDTATFSSRCEVLEA